MKKVKFSCFFQEIVIIYKVNTYLYNNIKTNMIKKIISFALLIGLLSNSFIINNTYAKSLDLDMVNINAENNLFCSNILNNKVAENIKYETQSKIRSIIKKIGNKNKYSDKKLVAVNNKIYKMATTKKSIANNKKKQALYLFVMTELDKIIKNPSILSKSYKQNECKLAFKLGSDVEQIAKNRWYVVGYNKNRFEQFNNNELDRDEKDENPFLGYDKENNNEKKKNEISEISKKREKMKIEKVEEDLKKEADKRREIERVRDVKYINSSYNYNSKDFVDNELKTHWFTKNVKDFLEKTIYKYDDGSFHIRNGVAYDDDTLKKYPNLIHPDYPDMKINYKFNFFVDNILNKENVLSNDIKDENLNNYKNWTYKKINVSIPKDLREKLEKVSWNTTINKNFNSYVYNSKELYNYIWKLLTKTNTFQQYHLRPIITSNDYIVKNWEKYIRNSKGKLVPVDYLWSKDKIENYDISKLPIYFNQARPLRWSWIDTLLTYAWWENYHNHASKKERILTLLGKNPLYWTGSINRTGWNGTIFGPNPIEYMGWLTKKEYEEIKNYIDEIAKLEKEVTKLEMKKKYGNKLKGTSTTDVINMYMKQERSNSINYDSQINRYKKRIEELKDKKNKLYLKWFDRKNLCFGVNNYFFDRDTFKRVYQNKTEEFIKGIWVDRKKSIKSSKYYKQLVCTNFIKR